MKKCLQKRLVIVAKVLEKLGKSQGKFVLMLYFNYEEYNEDDIVNYLNPLSVESSYPSHEVHMTLFFETKIELNNAIKKVKTNFPHINYRFYTIKEYLKELED